MPKHSLEGYSDDGLERTRAALDENYAAIAHARKAHDYEAAPHLEFMSELQASEDYPFQSELNELILAEAATVDPLIVEGYRLDKKIRRYENEREANDKFQGLMTKVLAQNKEKLDSMQEPFTGDIEGVSFLAKRAAEVHAGVIEVLKRKEKKKDDYVTLAELLSEFNEIALSVDQIKARSFAPDLRKKDDLA